jgi:hypothetical protein
MDIASIAVNTAEIAKPLDSQFKFSILNSQLLNQHLPMLKLTSLAIALLTVISIVPKSDAAMTTDRHLSLQHPTGEFHAQVNYENRHRGEMKRQDHARRDRYHPQVVKSREHHAQYHSKNRHDR